MATSKLPATVDITQLIERLNTFEERCGVRFEALRAESFFAREGEFKVSDFTGYKKSPLRSESFIEVKGALFVRVSGEVHARDGLTIASKLDVVITTYDEKGRVLNTDKKSIADPSVFYGLQPFYVVTNADVSEVAKIRVYPQQRK